MLRLVIGNKKYSSWSLRGWLATRLSGAPFEELLVPLDMPDTAQNIRRVSPSGRVPALIDGELSVWDTLAIAEYLHEKFPRAGLWPAEAAQRARARSVSAEMHSGFMNLRDDCTMRIVETRPYQPLRAETQGDVDRIVEIWEDCLRKSGGPWLFGAQPCLADVFYASVVSRFRTYSIPLRGAAASYCSHVWAWPALQEWVAGARAETLRAIYHEDAETRRAVYHEK